MGNSVPGGPDAPPPVAESVFGAGLTKAKAYANVMAEHGVERGLIGPREVGRLWERHLLNSAVLAELVDYGAAIVDVGTGAGLPGIPLAIARPDLDIVLLDPMARRIEWLEEVADELGLAVTIVRGRAEERLIRERVAGADVVTARALAPLARLSRWCLPLTRPGGRVLAMKGASADDEIARDRESVLSAGAESVESMRCGARILDTPTTVVSVTRGEQLGRQRRTQRSRRSSM